jgi:cation diffusion facilitator family transporter
MSADCCADKEQELAPLRERQGRVLKAVLLINALMFGVEFSAGLVTHSTALLADSLDMLGDAAVYGFSLYVLGRSARWRASAAFLKGLLMAAFGVGVLAEGVRRALVGVAPEPAGMGAVALLALGANAACLVLLLRHRTDDLTMRSTWLCSRNDVLANVGVLAAAGAVALTGSRWPDLVVGGVIAVLSLQSAWSVLRESGAALHAARSAPREAHS